LVVRLIWFSSALSFSPRQVPTQAVIHRQPRHRFLLPFLGLGNQAVHSLDLSGQLLMPVEIAGEQFR
jgi:hypothetical protein